ncbi:YqcI/YcgG family protein [Streptomyces sp. NPDC032472]|uniref:YqcI/YcgG family protein n=1 Tax=Streptomyces sp. NPDC032472 TaxID=3155018 RepID=UPI0033C629B0
MTNKLPVSNSVDGWIFEPSAPREIEWERDAADKFSRLMMDEERPFPCVYSVDAFRTENLRYAFIPQGEGAGEHLAMALREYVRIAPSLGRRTSLVTFFAPTPGNETLEDYRSMFWDTLQTLHGLDDSPWPSEVPTDTDSEWWEFCFAGMKLFIAANAPAYEFRDSRHFDYFSIAFQPRFVFDDITEDTPAGKNGRKLIRERLHSYDKIPPTPVLGDFGTPGIREWHQYFLEDHNQPPQSDAKCPFRNR